MRCGSNHLTIMCSDVGDVSLCIACPMGTNMKGDPRISLNLG